MWEQNVANNQIIQERTILCFGAKWLHSDRVILADTQQAEGGVRDDSDLCWKLWDLLDKADVVVTQNGDHFDLRVINSRFLMHGLLPPSPYRTVDTKKAAKAAAMFTSNKLEWLSQHLAPSKKDAHKDFPGFELWDECLKGNVKAWRAMRKYNEQDVRTTEAVYLRLRPWIKNHPHVGAKDVHSCPKCGSEDVQYRGTQRTNTALKQRVHCTACGGWATVLRKELRNG
jgi:hypothetical protein